MWSRWGEPGAGVGSVEGRLGMWGRGRWRRRGLWGGGACEGGGGCGGGALEGRFLGESMACGGARPMER